MANAINVSGSNQGRTGGFSSFVTNFLRRGKSGPGTTAYNQQKNLPTYGPSAPKTPTGLTGLKSVSPTLPSSMTFGTPRQVAQTTVNRNSTYGPSAPTTTSLSGTPTGTTGQTSTMNMASLTPEQQREADARAYLQDENAASQEAGSKNLVNALRGDSGNSSTSTAGSDDAYLNSLFANEPSQFNTASYTPSQSSDILEALRQQITGLSGLSADEKKLQDELTTFQENARMGISGLEGQGRGIALGLVRGQQGKLAEQAGIKEQTLLDRLASASAQRQNALQAATQNYNAASQEQSRLDQMNQYQQQRADQQAQYGQQSEMELLKSGYQPVTGGLLQVKQMGLTPDQLVKVGGKVYIKPQAQAAETKFFTIGDTLVDSNGNVVYKGDTSKVHEIGGSLVDDQGNVVYQGQTEQKPMSAEASKLVANAQSGLSAIATIEGVLGSDKKGGRPLLASQTYKAAEANLIDVIGRLRSGGAITSDEEKRFKALLPQRRDSYSSSVYKLNELKTLLNTTLQQVGAPSGGGGDDIDSFLDSFSNAGSQALNGSQATGAQAATAISQNYQSGSFGGQCGRFVNRITGLQMGNTYESKMRYVNPAIGRSEAVQPGDVFVMPYKGYGHTGFVAPGEWIKKADGSYDIPVVDSNWNNTSAPERVAHHYINSRKMSGFARVGVKTQPVSFA